MRQSLSLLLSRKLKVEAIGEAAEGESLQRQLASFRPTWLILDWALPGRPTPEACRHLRDGPAPVQLVILSVHEQDAAPAKMLAVPFIHKARPAQEVIEQLQQLFNPAV